MLTGELRNQIDGIWNDFWSGGLSNPLQVIEQITYLIFIKRLDEGKVYVPERAAVAMMNFFREGNLTALREIGRSFA